jgi:hypothetical protein
MPPRYPAAKQRALQQTNNVSRFKGRKIPENSAGTRSQNLTLVFASDPHLFQYQFNLLLILVGMVLIFWRPSPRLPPSFVSRLCDNFVFANILPFLSEEGDIAA